MSIKYSDVKPREGGPYSLFCYTCKRWIPNAANDEMQKKGVYAHNHFCYEQDGKITIVCEEGKPEKEDFKIG